MRKVFRIAPLLLLSGCSSTGTFEWPWRDADLIEVNMLGVTISWPVIAIAVALVAAVWAIKAKIRRARDDK